MFVKAHPATRWTSTEWLALFNPQRASLITAQFAQKASMASSATIARRLRDPGLSSRSIRILVTPTPITFAERRSVLQVLEQYGPVEAFKMSPGFYSSFISLTKETMTAEKLVANSPLTYHITEAARSPSNDLYIADLDEPESLSSPQPLVTGQQVKKWAPVKPGGLGSQSPDNLQVQNDGETQAQKQFTLEIFTEPEYNHRFAMYGSALHGPWPEVYKEDRSFMTMTLKQTLPKTMTGKGLAHWLVSLGSARRLDRKVKRRVLRRWLPSKMKNQDEEDLSGH